MSTYVAPKAAASPATTAFMSWIAGPASGAIGECRRGERRTGCSRRRGEWGVRHQGVKLGEDAV